MNLTGIWIFVFSISICWCALVPFRDSIEIVFTPDDIKKTTDYALWKIPSVKNNFKTTVKQKMLNRLLSKDLQDINPNPELDEYAEFSTEQQPSQQPDKVPQIGDEFQTVEINIKKPNGVVKSVLKGPSDTEKKKAKLTVHDDNFHQNQVNSKQLQQDNEKLVKQADEKMKEFQTEHIGYSRPTRVKNVKHNFDQRYKKLPPILQDNKQEDQNDDDDDDSDENSGDENEEEQTNKKKPKDTFYDN